MKRVYKIIKKHASFFILILVMLTTLIEATSAWAVSLIAGVPNAETTTKGAFMAATESQFPILNQTSASGMPKRWTGFHFFTYGISDQVELASTIYNSTDPASNRIAASFGYKWANKLKDDDGLFSEWRFLLGQEYLYSVQGNEGFGVWSFAGISNRLKSTNTRFTLGASYGSSQIFGSNTLCMFAGIEQPFTKTVSFIADWFSGTHDIAALITAIQIQPLHRFVIITGPKWANNPASGSHAWMIEITLDI